MLVFFACEVILQMMVIIYVTLDPHMMMMMTMMMMIWMYLSNDSPFIIVEIVFATTAVITITVLWRWLSLTV